jgi:hypothetical protein
MQLAHSYPKRIAGICVLIPYTIEESVPNNSAKIDPNLEELNSQHNQEENRWRGGESNNLDTIK